MLIPIKNSYSSKRVLLAEWGLHRWRLFHMLPRWGPKSNEFKVSKRINRRDILLSMGEILKKNKKPKLSNSTWLLVKVASLKTKDHTQPLLRLGKLLVLAKISSILLRLSLRKSGWREGGSSERKASNLQQKKPK